MQVKRISIQRIKDANEQAGYHFFDADTLRFFRSRISEYAYTGPGGTFFVTSEQFSPVHPRYYSVRQALDDGSIETIGEFQQYDTRAQAHTAAQRYAREGVNEA